MGTKKRRNLNLFLRRKLSEEAEIWERISERNRHEREIVKLYQEMRPRVDQHTDRPILILRFTNRSGSNYLCNCLTATGRFDDAGEAFNWEVVTKRSARRGISSFPEYCIQHIGEVGDPRKHVVVKAGIRQLIMLWKHGIVGPEGLFRNTKYVNMERRDSLAQAVSYSIAYQTGQFNSRQDKRKSSAEFDANDIQKRLTFIVSQNAMAQEFFSSVDLPVFPVLYETLVSKRSEVLARLADFLAMETLQVDESEVVLEKQRTATNHEFEKRFRQLMTGRFVNWTRE